MRKLSEAQAKALREIADGQAYAPTSKTVTLASLVGRGLITPLDPATGYQLTSQGRTELGLPMGPEAFDHLPADHPAPVTEDDRCDREKYEGTPARFNPEVIDQVHGQALRLNSPGSGVLVPRFEAPRPNTVRGLRSAEDVQADRDELLKPVNGHSISEEKADEILDTWHEVPNRADRRRERHAAKVAGRREMRRRVTPKRRRYNSHRALSELNVNA